MLNVSNEPLFEIWDYLVFAFVILGSLGIGAYYACANKTTDEYFLANRKLKIFPVGISLLVTYLSAINILGIPAEMFYFGVELWFFVIGFTFGSFITCATFVPLLHPLKITTINEYVYMRYRKKWIIYCCCTIQLSVATIVGGVVLFGPATMMESFAGMPVWASMLATSLIATVYTSIGGFKAVIWSDVFQAIGILVGLLAVLILGCKEVGSLTEVFEVYASHGRGNLNLDTSLTVRSTIWCYTIGTGLGTMAMFGISQSAVQRFCAMPTLRAAQKTLLISVPGCFIMNSLACISGVIAFAYYTKLGCDPLRAGVMSNPNQIIPQFIKDVLKYPALPGIFSACIFCGTVSTLSSTYNCCSALLWNDVLRDLLVKYKLTESRKSLITKFITVIAALAATASGFMIAEMGGTLVQMIVVVTGVLITPLCALVNLGALSPRTSWKSAGIASVCSFAFVLYISVGGVLYGTNNDLLPTVTHNCSALLSTELSNSSMTPGDERITPLFSAVMPGHDSDQVSEVWTEQPLQPEQQRVSFMFRISHIWYFPLGFILATTLGLILSYVPGLGEDEEIDPKLVFPFMRRWLKQPKYKLYEKADNGLFVSPSDEKVKIDLDNKTVTI